MRRRLSPAEAWCWVARMLGTEADAHAYAWPRTAEDQAAAAELAEAANAAHAHAKELGANSRTWKSAMRKWEAAPDIKRGRAFQRSTPGSLPAGPPTRDRRRES